jgi:hypothetical protein
LAADGSPGEECASALWDWLDDGFNGREDVLATGLLGDHATVQFVLRDGERWLVTAPISGADNLPTSAHETTAAAVARAAAERTKAVFAARDVGRSVRLRHLRDEIAASGPGLLLVPALAIVLWLMLTLGPPDWMTGKLAFVAATMGGTILVWAALLFAAAGIAARMGRRADARRLRRDAHRFATSSPFSSGPARSLSTSQIDAMKSCLTARSQWAARALERANAGGGTAINGGFPMQWWRDMERRRYRRLFGPVSPPVRLAFYPRVTTLLAPRSRFDGEAGWCFLGPLTLALFLALALILAGAPAAATFVIGGAVGGAAGLLALVALMTLRRRVRRRWRTRVQARRTALLEACDWVLAGRAVGLSANGRHARWLERMRAYA